MNQYEITSLNRGLEYTEYIKAVSILDSISRFYSAYGYQEILRIEITK